MAALCAGIQLRLARPSSVIFGKNQKTLQVSGPFLNSRTNFQSYCHIALGYSKHALRRKCPPCQAQVASGGSSGLDALIFDCDGVILESEDLHRRAYNATFQHFGVQCPGSSKPVDWSPEFYDDLQNRIGGGKPKMRWYFSVHGWPTSVILPEAPEAEAAQSALVDALQDWKSLHYQEIIGSGQVDPRPGVLELMDSARSQGIQVAVCSAATRESVVFTLLRLLGKERFESLDCFLAGDDVKNKKPDPSIYKIAAQKLGVDPSRCLVVEDSSIGLQAALGAGMNCLITYTSSTATQPFEGAFAVLPSLAGFQLSDVETLLTAASR